MTTQQRRRAENDKPIASFEKNHRQTFRVALRRDEHGDKAVISVMDRDPANIERRICGLAIAVDLVPQLVDALHGAAAAAKREGQR
jgi:hypothetical protein